MDRAEVLAAPHTGTESPFRDGLGERRHHVDPTGASVEWLCLRPDLAAVPSFEFALRERVSRLSSFRHPAFARVRGVERSAHAGDALVLVSDEAPGIRLSTFLDTASARKLSIDLTASLGLIRQLVTAIAALHETARDAAHGAIAPERLILTPHGRLVITEYALGSALEQLLLSRDKYWTDLRVALPRMAGLPRFDHVTDVTQLGVVALSLILGRSLHDDEYPSRIVEVIHGAQAIAARGAAEPLHPTLRSWLERALQVDPRQSFPSAIDARNALDKAIAESGCDASPVSLETLIARYHAPDRPASIAAAHTPPPMPVSITFPREEPPAAAHAASPAPVPMPVRHDPPAPMSARYEPAAPAVSHHQDSIPSIKHVELSVNELADVMTAPSSSRRWMLVAAGVVVVAAVGAGATIGAPRFMKKPVAVAVTGTLVVTTEPPGAHAMVDGKAQGTTPLTLTLDAGSHKLELRGAGGVRTIPVVIKAGEQVSQYVDLPKAAVEVGQLRVRTEPAGAEVRIDDTSYGVAPLLLSSLAPGDHVVSARGDAGTATQAITIEAGVTASVMLALAKTETAPLSGWISVSAKFPVQIFENGALLGTNESDKVMVASGRHEYELRNDALGYRGTRTVQVTPGKLSSLSIEPPTGSLALNAQPWAEVWIDGAKVGETPIGNLSLPIGSHEVIFRHPELGEQKQTALVTLTAPTRLSANFKKP